MNKCIYHSADFDGICSARIVDYAVGVDKFFGMNYDKSLDLSKFSKEDNVYMVDFSLPHAEMIELSNRCNLIWIDHHKTNLGLDLSQFNGEALIFNKDLAACELTWKYFFAKKMPLAVHLLGRYDVWDHTNKDVLPFQYGMRSISSGMGEIYLWQSLLENDNCVTEIVQRGNVVLDYVEKLDEKYCRTVAFEIRFEGLDFIALNIPFANSYTFKSLFDKYDNFITFNYNGAVWNVSMKSNTEDISKIALKYGGGGHEKSAGFVAKSIKFKGNILYVKS